MGGCMAANTHQSKSNYSLPTTRSVEQSQLPPTISLKLKGNSGISTESSKEGDKVNSPPPSNAELLEDEQEENDEMKEWRTDSVILQRPKRIRKRNDDPRQCQKKIPNKFKKFMNSEIIEGESTENSLNSTITLNSGGFDMEFVLSKECAGPLVVPFIDYQQYFI